MKSWILEKDEITAELTATERGAVFRLTYHQGSTGRLIVNAVRQIGDKIEGRTIRGLSRANSGGVTGNFASYFVINLDRDITKADLFVANAATGRSSGKGDDVAAYVEFQTSPERPVEMRVGTSLISWEQAARNLQAETGGGFDAVQARVAKNLGIQSWPD